MPDGYLRLHYGALADPAEQQANEQGYTLNGFGPIVERMFAHALSLHMADLLTDAMYRKVLQRLNDQAAKHAERLEEE